MVTMMILLVVAVVGYLLISWLANNAKLVVPTAFAGSPSGSVGDTVSLNIPKRKVNYFLGKEKVDVSNYEKIVIKGKSLEKMGIPDNAIAYVVKCNPTEIPDDSIVGRFIILNIDNDRTLEEYPMRTDYFRSNGKKVRRALEIVKVGLPEESVTKLIDRLLESQPLDCHMRLREEIRKKYDFASKFYSKKGESELIMSLTYRNNGQDLGFSFHSKKFLYGIVEYVSNKSF